MLKIPYADPNAPAIIIEIGNTKTSVATWVDGSVRSALHVSTVDESAFSEAFQAHRDGIPHGKVAATIIGSVVPVALERVRAHVTDQCEREPLVIGETIPLPMDVGVTDKKAIGVDRVCEAYAAFERLKTGCTVVALGTAITVDLVDDDGVLVGGAILPGVRMQLTALHERTAVLPQVEPGFPDQPFGRSTAEAIQTGVCRGVVGAIRNIVEGYATHLNRWPQVLASGGDLTLLQPHLDFVDTFVADLALRGVGLSYSRHLTEHGA
jgi:type III pantothenate kinase